MTNKDMSSLNDIYQVLKEPGQTSYILQLLWQDLTNNYDIVGPYFTLKESVDAQFILSGNYASFPDLRIENQFDCL